MKKTNQHRSAVALAMILSVCFFQIAQTRGQSLKISINVNSTVGIQPMKSFDIIPENELDFPAPASAGQARPVNAVGGFTITCKENNDILVRLDAPDFLVNSHKQTTPFKMNIAWQNSSSSDFRSLNWTGNRNNVLRMTKPGFTPEQKLKDDDLQAFVYLKSTTEIPLDTMEPYEGDVHVTIEY